MSCPDDIRPVDPDFLKNFNIRVYRERIPVTGGIELTRHCNLRCVHCYLDEQTRKKSDFRRVSMSKWLDVIDQVTSAGCLYLYFTGGESMLHPDFPEIYTHARKNGLMVMVFTNATVISDTILEIFDAYPPQHIDISIYGATRQTYESVTKVKGSYEKCMQGIEQLQSHGFVVKLKTILMSINQHELVAMERLAQDKGASFRFDAMIFPRLNGDKTPIQHRVAPDQVIEKEFLSNKLSAEWRDAYERMSGNKANADLYQCGAGLTLFHIDPDLQLRPCLMTSHVEFDLTNNGFQDVWSSENFLAFRKNGKKAPKACRECDLNVLCGYCPAFFRLETGDEDKIASYLCEIGRKRKQALDYNKKIIN